MVRIGRLIAMNIFIICSILCVKCLLSFSFSGPYTRRSKYSSRRMGEIISSEKSNFLNYEVFCVVEFRNNIYNLLLQFSTDWR